jgi:hypothetical protein
MSRDELDFSIEKGLLFIENRQLANGGFPCLLAQTTDCIVEDLLEFDDGVKKSKVTQEDDTIFPASLIGLSLLHLKDNAGARKILDHVASFLLQNKSHYGMWRHYRGVHQLATLIPNDLDNSSLASFVLRELGFPVPDNYSIFNSNRSKNGLFYTWVTLRPQWVSNSKYWMSMWEEYRHPIGQYYFWKLMPCEKRDIDAVVNSNVLFYLGEGENTEGVVDLMVQVIQEGREETCDKWYSRAIMIYYFFSKNIEKGIPKLEPLKEIIKNKILAEVKSDGQIFMSALETAMAVSALINAGYPQDIPKKSIQYLLDAQNPEGSWDKWVIYYNEPRKTTGCGDDAISTSFVLEALHKYKMYQLSLDPEFVAS